MTNLATLTPEMLTAANQVWRRGSDGDKYLKCQFIKFTPDGAALYTVVSFIDYSEEDADLSDVWAVSTVRVTEREGVVIAETLYATTLEFPTQKAAEAAFAQA